MGPTAVGKTSLSLFLAKHFHTEIFSSDSRQIYKEMNIGTAKPSQEELNLVKHHFIDTISIKDNYSAGKYEKEIIPKLEKYFQSNQFAILSGGTGLYIDAVITGLDHFPSISEDIDQRVDKLLEDKGLEYLSQELKTHDPEYYNKVDLQNSRRVSRALKVIYGSGKKYSSFLNQEKPPREFKVINILLDRDREELYQRINQRVDSMFEDGQLEEAKSLYPFKELRSLQTVGYQEIFEYLEGTFDLKNCLEEIKKNTRRYAKRQITWFKKYEVKSFHPSQQIEILDYIKEQTLL